MYTFFVRLCSHAGPHRNIPVLPVVVAAAAALLLFATASPPAEASDMARTHPALLRVFHAAPDAPPVDVLVARRSRIAEQVGYGDVSSKARIPAGVHDLRVVPRGASAAAAMATLELNALYDHRYLVVLTGLEGRHELLSVRLPVGCPMTKQRTQIRVLQAAPIGAAVDLKVERGPYLYRELEYGGISECLMLPAGNYELEVDAADFTWNVGAIEGRTELGPGNAYVLVIGPSKEVPERLVRIWAIPMLGGGHGLGQPSR